MSTTPSDIDLLLTVRSEDAHLEFKEAKSSFHFDKLVEYCVAFANEGGGRIVLGITDKLPRRVVGTGAFRSPEKTMSDLHQRLHMKVTCEEVMHANGRVLVFHVPSRPSGQPIHVDGRYLMRVGENLVPMTPDQLRPIFDEGQPDWLSRFAQTGCDDAEVVKLLDTQGYFDLMGWPYPANRIAVLDRLQREGLIAPDNDRWAISNLGAILFAKRLDKFKSLARKAPRVIVYEGTNKLKTNFDRTGRFGYAVGFRGIVEYINAIVPSNEVIEQALRREVTMFPKIAIRELVANALIHQDFEETGTSVVIEIYDDRMEISNPGRPFISTERFIDEYQSRNESLADLMRRMGICEEKGSGIDKVIHAVESYQLPAPDFRAGERRTSVVLFAHQAFDEMDREARIRACYQHCCLKYVMNERMTNRSLRERFKLPESKSNTVSQIIAATVERGQIKTADESQKSPRYRSYAPSWA